MKVWYRFVFISALVTGMVSATFCQEPVVRGRVGRDYRSGDVYTLTVESDGSFLLRFPAGSEPELADCLDKIFRGYGLREQREVQFVPEVHADAVRELEELMHDRNHIIVIRDKWTKDGRRLSSWKLLPSPNRLTVFMQIGEEEHSDNIWEEQHSDNRPFTGLAVGTPLGDHIQSGELREIDRETVQLTLRFDDEGKARLQKFISKKAGHKLSLLAEGVRVGRSQIPLGGDGGSLTFTLSPDKLKRLQHAFVMSELELIRTD